MNLNIADFITKKIINNDDTNGRNRFIVSTLGMSNVC